MEEENSENYLGDEDHLLKIRDKGVAMEEDGLPKSTSPSKQNPSQALVSDVVTSLKKMLFVLGSVVVVFIALRNSLTLHLQNFWGASGNFWQQQWDNMMSLFGNDPYNLMVYGSLIVSYLVYWGIGILYIFHIFYDHLFAFIILKCLVSFSFQYVNRIHNKFLLTY